MTIAVLPLTDAEASHVVRGRAALLTRLPSAKFDDVVWETEDLRTKAGMKTPRLYFTVNRSVTEAMPPRYGNVVKAWVSQQSGTPSRMKQRVDAARWVWRAVAERLGAAAADAFQWSDFQLADLQRAEQLMIDAGGAQSSVNKTAGTMGDMARDLAKVGIAPPLVFRPATKRSGDSNNHRVDDPQARATGVLTPAALHAIADIFAHAVTPADQVYSALLTLLIAAGIRWNEVLCIPLHALEDEQYDSRDVAGRLVRRDRTYLRYYKSKSQREGGDGVPSFERVPLTSSQAALARLAVDRMVACCADARAVASELRRMGGQWRWTGPVRPQFLNRDSIAEALGCGPHSADQILRDHGEEDPASRARRAPTRRIALDVFEDYMTKRIVWRRLWTVEPRGVNKGLHAADALV